MLGFYIGFLMSRMHNEARSNYENTTILLLIGWIPVFLISMMKHEAIVPTSISIAAFVGLVLATLTNVVGLYAINYVFTNLKAYVAGNFLLLECVFALILGWVLYGESITAGIMLGGLLIMASAVAVNNISKADEEAPSPLLDEANSKAN